MFVGADPAEGGVTTDFSRKNFFSILIRKISCSKIVLGCLCICVCVLQCCVTGRVLFIFCCLTVQNIHIFSLITRGNDIVFKNGYKWL